MMPFSALAFYLSWLWGRLRRRERDVAATPTTQHPSERTSL